MSGPDIAEIARRKLTLLTHQIHSLPVVVLMPHSRCNARCVMCDIWKANSRKSELSVEDVGRMIAAFRRFHVRRVVLTGGEALMHPDLWALASTLRAEGLAITLLTTGISLGRHAAEVARLCDDIVVSLDGPREVHDGIRGVNGAFDLLAAGVAAVKALRSDMFAIARCVVQRKNFRALPEVVGAARAIGADQVSFLPADVSTKAFNRPSPWERERVDEIAVGAEQIGELSLAIESLIAARPLDGFVAQTPERLRALVQHYAALHGGGEFPKVSCNAPWVSTVVEADGTVRPCYFHEALGNIHSSSLEEILNSPGAVRFRQNLDVSSDPICRSCVCTLRVGLRSEV